MTIDPFSRIACVYGRYPLGSTLQAGRLQAGRPPAHGRRGHARRCRGFHAQQAVEKALKVALVMADMDFPRTHDLRALVDIAVDSGVAVPDFDP
jgi:hypothetical protein